jgi:endoglycosylceramidase
MRYSLIVLLVALQGPAAAAAVAGTQLERIRASASDAFLYDSSGRVRVFHGMNAQTKDAPWYPLWMLHNTTLLDEFASWGLNMIRIGWMWTGFNPSGPAVFDDEYFDTTQQIVQNLADRGIYSLLDMHQDCLSSKFCLYDGAPLWVVNKSVPAHPFPWPLTGDCSSRAWGKNEVTEAAGRAYQDIYDNTLGMRDDLAAFWRESAKRWAGNTNVLGYELINEPFAGDVFQRPELLLPGVAGATNLQPLYAALAAAIRDHDDEQLLFYEPVTWGMEFPSDSNSTVVAKLLGSGFTDVPGGHHYRNRSVLSFHSYVPAWDTGVVLDAIAADVRGLGGSSFMTEWGICDDKLGECTRIMELCDGDRFQSWCDDGGGLGVAAWVPPPAGYVDILSRTYARAIAGRPLNTSYNQGTGHFQLCYVLDAAIAAPTEIFAAFTLHYPNGSATVTATDNVEVIVAEADRRVTARPKGGARVSGETACISISRKPQPQPKPA